jgi:hypothetical protein
MSADSSAMDITNLVLDLALKAIKASQESFDPGVDRDAAVRGRLTMERQKLKDAIRKASGETAEEARRKP